MKNLWYLTVLLLTCCSSFVSGQIASGGSKNLGRVMAAGDSLTKGWDTQGLGGYRGRLWSLLSTAKIRFTVTGSETGDSWNLPPHWVFHEGHNGWKTEDVTNNIAQWIIINNPDTLLIRVGTNNTLDWNNPTLTEQKYRDLISTVVTTKPTIKIYLANIPDCNITTEWYFYHEIHATNVNNSVNTIVAEFRGLGFKINKVNTRLLDPAVDFRDSVHPNVGGFEKDAQHWFNDIIGSRN